MPDAAWRPDLVDALQQPIWIARADGTFMRGNACWHDLTGHAATPHSAPWWQDTVHPDDIDRLAARWATGTHDPDPFEVEFRLRHEGGWRWYLARVARDHDTNPPAWVAIGMDIDERRQARESLQRSEARLQELVANADDVIYTLGLDGMLRDVNPAAERVLGYSREELLSRPFEEIVVPEQVPFTRGMLDRKLAGEPASRYELDVMTRDGRRVTLEINTRLVSEGDVPVAISGVARDISNRRQRIRQAELSATVGAALTSTAALDEQLQATSQAIVDHLGAAFARIWLISDDDPDLLELRASAGQYTHLDGGHSRIRIGEFKIGRIAARRAPFLSNDVTTDPEISDRDWARHERMTAFAGYPILRGQHLLGVIGLFARHRLDATTQSVLHAVADAVAVAIERNLAERARDTLFTREQEARVWAEVAETRYRNLFEGVADAIFVIDEHLRVRDVNRAALALVGYAREELLHTSIDRLTISPVPWSAQQRDNLVAAGSWQGEMTLRHRAGHVVPVEVRATVVQLPTGPVFLAAARDVTERKHLERLQRDFLAMVTHDIRTPLTSIKGWLQLLERRQRMDDRDRRVVSRSLEQAETISRLIDDLADLVRIEAGQLALHRAPADLLDIVRDHLATVQEQTDHHTLRLETPERELPGQWDRGRVGQILQNLLTNAVKYSPAGGEVVVRVRREGGTVRLEIADEGIGIAPDHLPLLFERFYRAEATGAGGLGLGLHITRMLVEAHGGEISATSELGVGSTLSVTLPLVPVDG